MTSEGEEFFYHEALVHPAAMAHPAPRKALILGGGGGGAVEELLKHPSIERVVWPSWTRPWCIFRASICKPCIAAHSMMPVLKSA